jgi:Icc protein
MSLKFALVTDIHHGPDIGKKMGTKAGFLMQSFIKAAQKFDAEFIIDLGDRITSAKSDTDALARKIVDKERLRRISAYYNQIAVPKYYVMGNHDVRNLTRDENAEILGKPATSYTIEHNNYRFVIWNPTVTTERYQPFVLQDSELNWLKSAVNQSNKPIILFSHVPLDDTPKDLDKSLIAPPRSIPRFYYDQSKQVREILENSGKVAACFAGHLHTERLNTINGIHYITQQSLSAQVKKTDEAHGSYSLIKLKDDKIVIKIKGHDSKTLRLPINTP